MQKLKRYLSVFGVAGFVAGATIGVVVKPASAYGWRLHPSACTPTKFTVNYAQGDDDGTEFTNDLGLANVDPTNDADFICPMPDDSHLPKNSISTITIHVYDGSSAENVSVKACTSDANDQQGGTCGTEVSTSSTGYQTLSPASGGSVSASYRAYLLARLPNDSGAQPSKLTGLYFADANGF